MQYIHYGSKQFLKQRFEEVKNYGWVKPHGGLWASAVDAEYGWKQWNEHAEWHECIEDNAFRFELAAGAEVIHIRKLEDLVGLPEDGMSEFKISGTVCLDFEKMRKSGIDAIELHLSEDHRLYWALYGWDCDCILIMNPDIVKGVEK